jgi:hypothetical protein
MMPNTAEGLPLLEQLFWYENRHSNYPNACVNCKKPVKVFHGFGKGYAEFCSVGCVRTSKDVRSRVKDTVRSRYGVDNVSQAEEVRCKVSSTVMSKFGGFFHPAARTKTNVSRYGTENPLWLPDVSARRKITRHRASLAKLTYPEGFVPQFSEDEYLEDGSGRYAILHAKCGKTFTHRVPFTDISCRFCDGGQIFA